MIFKSAAMRNVLTQIETVAPTDTTVLILGETGTGKELIASAIHEQSSRSQNRFVKVNCAAIPSGLLESELFGHDKGAFTGALTKRIGRFELADGGTLLLDEVGDIPIELQSKLLRVLQEREFERLGSSFTLRTNVRVVAATHRNLALMARQGQFRADLFYRLSVFPLIVPSLRERPDDISVLTPYFVSEVCSRVKKRIDVIPSEVLERLRQYNWPGNIRELQNVIERAVILSKDNVLRLLPGELEKPDPLDDAPFCSKTNTLMEVEREHIVQALEDANWVIGGNQGAARKLGVPRTTLIYKMRRLGVNRSLQSGV